MFVNPVTAITGVTGVLLVHAVTILRPGKKRKLQSSESSSPTQAQEPDSEQENGLVERLQMELAELKNLEVEHTQLREHQEVGRAKAERLIEETSRLRKDYKESAKQNKETNIKLEKLMRDNDQLEKLINEEEMKDHQVEEVTARLVVAGFEKESVELQCPEVSVWVRLLKMRVRGSLHCNTKQARGNKLLKKEVESMEQKFESASRKSVELGHKLQILDKRRQHEKETISVIRNSASKKLKAMKKSLESMSMELEQRQGELDSMSNELDEAKNELKSGPLLHHGPDHQDHHCVPVFNQLDALFSPRRLLDISDADLQLGLGAHTMEDLFGGGDINPVRMFGTNHQKYPPLRSGSIIHKMIKAPSGNPIDDFPREKLKTITPVLVLKLSRELACLQRQGSEVDIDRLLEVTFQHRFVTMVAWSPETLLTKDDLVDMKVMSWYDKETMMLLKGKQGSSTSRETLDPKTTERSSVIRKSFKCSVNDKEYTFEAHIGRLIMYHFRSFPDFAGMDVSHLCACWWCLNVLDEHIKFEYSWLNESIRKCHDKDCNSTKCNCGMNPPCIFPEPHGHTNNRTK